MRKNRNKDRNKNNPQNLLIRTTEGYVQGIERDGIIQFTGIPFAKPPIGDLRFEPPQSLEERPEQDVYDATRTLDSIPVCSQIWRGIISTSGDEDCLYLNIFVPSKSNKKKNKNRKLPVMLWIFGGRFLHGSGSSSLYDATNWLNNPNANDVIIVTINYRLGMIIV